MSRTIAFGKLTHFASLGRNRFLRTKGLHITEVDNELFLCPVTPRGMASSCRIVVPMTAAPEIADALISAATPVLHDQLGYWPPPNNAKAIRACRLLVLAYQRREEHAAYSRIIDEAAAIAAEAIHMPVEAE
jgi:hypothetical protein